MRAGTSEKVRARAHALRSTAAGLPRSKPYNAAARGLPNRLGSGGGPRRPAPISWSPTPAVRETVRSAEHLSEELGGVPLAHEQAAAYCKRLEIALAE
jgi:hypothetical protein